MTQPDPAKSVDDLKADVYAALDDLRAKLMAYRKGAKKPPIFLRERDAPEMREDAFGDARVFSNRFQMMREMARGSIGAEVGVQHGNFSRFLLDTFDPAELHLFDMSKHLLRADVENDARVHLHIGDSSSRLRGLPDDHFDWIYIDGDHSYAGVRKDADVALTKVKRGGTLFFNDYTPWSLGEAIPYGVIPLVNELVNDGLPFTGIALTQNGYFDVALRRP